MLLNYQSLLLLCCFFFLVSLMDSMGSSLNTTGTSIQADTGNSPAVSKDALKDTESVLTQKGM